MQREAARLSLIAPALASFATTDHFLNRNFRVISRPASLAPAAAGPKASSGFGWLTPPASIPRRSCRPIIASRDWCGLVPHGGASRSFWPERSRVMWGFLQAYADTKDKKR